MFRRKPEFSNAISQQFKPDDLYRYGISGDITAVAYDVVQSLMAVGTAQGAVHIFGEGTVQVNFAVKSGSPIKYLGFVKGVYLAIVDANQIVTIYALDERNIWADYAVPGRIVSQYTDPALDWLFLGMENGQVLVYDIDRGIISPFRIDNIQKQVSPNSRMSPAVSVAMHPRDPSQLLICYTDVAAVFSIADTSILFHCPVPKSGSIPGRFTKAMWHPSGSHILTSQSDGTLSFWDGQTGSFLTTRRATSAPPVSQIAANPHAADVPVVWCSHEEAESTFIVYGDGNNLTMVDFGPTPYVAVTKYDSMGQFFAKGKSKTIELPAAATTLISLPRDSPYFGGNFNPAHMLVLLKTNEQKVIKLPKFEIKLLDGSILPPALSWRAAQETCVNLEVVSRSQWVGMMMSSPHPYLRGGVPAKATQRRSPTCTVVALGGRDGAIKFFDESKSTGSDFRVLETSIADLVPDESNHGVAKISLAGTVGEMAAASISGNVYLFSFKKNTFGFDGMRLSENVIQNIAHRSNPEIREGFLPQWMIRNTGGGSVTALCHSDVGFVAVGYNDGRIVVIDRRGPAIIYEEKLNPKTGYPTYFSFGIQTFGTENYSSILLSAGTSRGEVVLYKVLPRPQGGYQVARAMDYSHSKDPVTYLAHIDLKAGRSASAAPNFMAQLSQGIMITGGLLVLSAKDARIFNVTGTKPKLEHKSLSPPVLGGGFACLREGDALGLVTVNNKGVVQVYSIPSLTNLFSYQVPYARIHGDTVVSSLNGDVLVRLDPHTSALMGVWGLGYQPGLDTLYRQIQLPPRPTISTTTWITGKQFVKTEDLDFLISGPRRPQSKRKNAEELVAKENEEKNKNRPQHRKEQQQGWFAAGNASPTARSGGMTWGQTFDSYYDSAENAVNDTLDDWMGMIQSGKKSATNSAIKGVARSKLGL